MRTLAILASAAAAAADWTIIAPSVGTISTGVAFTSASTGYLPVSQNGVGTSILRSDDGGITWGQPATEPFALLLLDITAYQTNVAVVGALTLEYSNDSGATFNSSLAALGAGQCIRNIGPREQEIGFAAVGQWGLLTVNNGPLVSFNAGKTYVTKNVTGMAASARYGAFPDDKTWFIAAGDWPGEGNDDDAPPTDNDPPAPFFGGSGWAVNPAHYFGSEQIPSGSVVVKIQGARLHLLREPAGTHRWAFVRKEHMAAANFDPKYKVGNVTTWDAQIASTTDAGNTWNVLFTRTGQFYLNGIECTTPEQCCAVGESGAGTTGGGTFIWCTNDGGANWNETLIDLDADSSLIDIAYVGPNEFWAVGGEFGTFGPTAPHFLHTTDGGNTWVTEAPSNIVDQYAIAIDCVPSANNCWANMLDILTQESSVAAWQPVNATRSA